MLDFLRYLHESDALQMIREHPLFAPSALWQTWLSETFVGFSSEKLLVLSGHRFAKSMEVAPTFFEPQTNQTRIHSAVASARRVLMRQVIHSRPNLRSLRAGFRKLYPKSDLLAGHETMAELHPNVYFRTLEAFVLRSNRYAPHNLLEIGAGAGVNVAFYRELNPTMQCAIVDLPESVLVGYAFLKTVYPNLRICLPHQIHATYPKDGFDIVFLLPFQAHLWPVEEFDLCFNMSSFQEMDIEVVNNYLEFILERLAAGGLLISVNQRVSRHIEGNSLDSYRFENFGTTPLVKDAQFHTWLAGVPGVEVAYCEVEKERHVDCEP